MLPLYFAVAVAVYVSYRSLHVVKELLDACLEGAETSELPNLAMSDSEEESQSSNEESDLHELLKDKPKAKDVQALIDKCPDAVREINEDGKLPLHTAVMEGASVDVIRVLLKADPTAAEKTMKVRDEDMLQDYKGVDILPLHLAILRTWLPDVIKALLKVYPGAVNARIRGKLPLALALQTDQLSDDAVLAVLAAYPDAAKETFSNECDVVILPLHIAMEKKSSEKVVKALIRAHPGAKKEENPFSKILLLHELLMHHKPSDKDVQNLIDKYPDAVSKRGKDGQLPLHIAVIKEASVGVIRVLLKADPSAAKKTATGSGGKDMLPLHSAITCHRSLDVVMELLCAYPEGAKARTALGDLPLNLALRYSVSDDVVLAVLAAYPGAAKEKMKDGRLPIKVCGEKKKSEDLMLKLLETDMPLRRDGTPVDHSGSWTACVASKADVAAGAVRRILSKSEGGFGVHIHALADTRDAEGRTALGLASFGPRTVIYEYLLFSRRYKLQNGAPEHLTKTSVVLRAQDLDEQADYGVIFDEADEDKNGKLDRNEISTLVVSKIGLDPELFLKGSKDESISKEDFVGICKRQLGDGPRNVVIKLMQKKDQWERECDARKKYKLDPKYVVSALPNIPSESEIAEALNRGDGGMKTIVDKFLDGINPGKYAIVMDAADRNLHQIFYQEQPKIDAARVMLRQVFEAVSHLHEKSLMHGDIKMLNIVRFRIDNRLRLIDLDASAKIVPIGADDESFAGAKFSSAVLPPEMIERIETEEQLQQYKKYWEGENDNCFKEKVAPKIYKKLGVVQARYVVKSFRTEGGETMYEGLPYKLVKSSENIDAWALGALAFTLLTGETLIPSTRDDDCAAGAAMHLLYSWGEQPEVLREVFKKIGDDKARDLVEQLLQKEPEKRPTVASLLETHPFFHPERDDKEMKERLERFEKNLERFEKNQENQVKQLEIMNANIAVIKKLSFESKFELRRTRHVLLKGIFEATEVSIPTTFVVLNDKLPPEPSDEELNKIKHAFLAFTAEGAEIHLEGDLKERYDLGMKWAKRIKHVGAKVAAGDVGKGAFEIINEGIKDLIVGMYLYLIDELTGEPVRAEGWPITITKPSKIVPKLLPLMQVGMRAMSIYNGTAGVARMFGYPVPKVPEAWSKGAQESIELLKQESSVEDFGVVHAEVKEGTEEEKSVRGASLREFVDFMTKNDPGLSTNKSGHFAGLKRIGDPEDGTALWTKLTDPVDIENALKKRASQREEEQLKHDEHIQKMAKEEVEKKEETKERISEEVKRLPTGMTSNEIILDELRKMGKAIAARMKRIVGFRTKKKDKNLPL
jgi:serine/threonine protein kinase/ankyrin repeat protein